MFVLNRNVGRKWRSVKNVKISQVTLPETSFSGMLSFQHTMYEG